MPGKIRTLLFSLALLSLTACAATVPSLPVDHDSVAPGTAVTRGGTTELALLGKPLRVGDPLPPVSLIDTHLRSVDLAQRRGEVLSLDTQVCEQQTRLLGEEGRRLSAGIIRITVSRDLPFAHKRFAEEAKLTDLLYLSDYQKSDFGLATGLLVDGIYLLARSVILVDKAGRVRYIQVVPEMSHLPDLEAAFARAEELNRE
jgi:thiol peroxidase